MAQMGNGSPDPGQGPFQCPVLPWKCYSAQHQAHREWQQSGKAHLDNYTGPWPLGALREGGTSHTQGQVLLKFLAFIPKENVHRGMPLAEAVAASGW